MKIALIGSTGFVGGNLAKQVAFDDGYNSQNIESIKGSKYDLIISAGAKAEVWKANQDPEADWQGIKRLLDSIKEVEAKHFILISTINVYPRFFDVDEDTKIKEGKSVDNYGNNRYRMEIFVKNNFPKVTIGRFPQIYGPGLKKNFVFDLIHDNALDFTHKDTSFQWYDVRKMWQDLQIAIDHGIDIVNLAVEPISAKQLADYVRPDLHFNNVAQKGAMKYDMQTKYGQIFGSSDKYIYHQDETLPSLKEFITTERKKLNK